MYELIKDYYSFTTKGRQPMAYGLITSLHSTTGAKVVAQHEYNYRLLDNGMSKLEKMFIYHQKKKRTLSETN